jgi:hypothetical protein
MEKLSKNCKHCSVELIVEVNWSKSSKDKTHYACKACRNGLERLRRHEKKEEIAIQQKKYRVKNRDVILKKQKEYQFSKYGMTEHDYKVLLKSQEGSCAICSGTTTAKSQYRMPIDHCHETGTVRGILCHHCNTGLGQFKDSIDSLKKAIEYLEKSKKD